MAALADRVQCCVTQQSPPPPPLVAGGAQSVLPVIERPWDKGVQILRRWGEEAFVLYSLYLNHLIW